MKDEAERLLKWLVTPPDGAVGMEMKMKHTASSPKQHSPSPPKVFGKVLPHHDASSSSSTIATSGTLDSSDDSIHDLPSHIPTPQTLELELNDILPIANIAQDAWSGLQQSLKGLNGLLLVESSNNIKKDKRTPQQPQSQPQRSTSPSRSPILTKEYWSRSPQRLGDGVMFFWKDDSMPPPSLPMDDSSSDSADNDNPTPPCEEQQRDDPQPPPLLQQQWLAQHTQNLHSTRSSTRMLEEGQ